MPPESPVGIACDRTVTRYFLGVTGEGARDGDLRSSKIADDVKLACKLHGLPRAGIRARNKNLEVGQRNFLGNTVFGASSRTQRNTTVSSPNSILVGGRDVVVDYLE
ncbi:MAG: hypothetical protein LC808_14255, partial [Actinobacteria bacterium]|nr:hypothetical protein [Actinomycetota bacterium]